MTRRILTSSSWSGDSVSLLAKIRQASAFIIYGMIQLIILKSCYSIDGYSVLLDIDLDPPDSWHSPVGRIPVWNSSWTKPPTQDQAVSWQKKNNNILILHLIVFPTNRSAITTYVFMNTTSISEHSRSLCKKSFKKFETV